MTAPSDDLQDLGADELAAAISAQKEAIASFEAEFVPLRQRYERLRQELRRLEAEAARRQRAAAGEEPAQPARRRGGTLISDVLSGRVRLDTSRPLASFRFSSLGRQEIYLNREGRADTAAISFYVKSDRTQHLAHTFAETEELRAAGLVMGVPGVPMERQGIFFVSEGKPGWLRLDQVFIEDPVPD